MEKKDHHLGNEWEPQVNEINGLLIYSIPIESSHTTLDFAFEIKEADLDVLKTDRYRYAVLYFSLHTLIQNTFGPGSHPRKFEQEEFNNILNNVLHSTSDELKFYISKFNKENNISLEHFINEFLTRKSTS